MLHFIVNSMYLLIITSAMFSNGSQFNYNEFLFSRKVFWGRPEKTSHLFIDMNLLTIFARSQRARATFAFSVHT